MESNDDLLKKLRNITKNKECWAESIGEVAAILDEDYSVSGKYKKFKYLLRVNSIIF